jgi:hypothetical protein
VPVISVIPLDIRDRSAIDRQTNSEFGSNIRRSLNDHVRATTGRPSLSLRATDENYANESENHNDSAGGIMSFHNWIL